jgi:hypothetical protein
LYWQKKYLNLLHKKNKQARRGVQNKMNYKSAITEASKEIVPEQKIQTRLERVIKYSTWPERPGWVKISYAWEDVPIRSTTAAQVPTPSRISLENYVRLQEKRKKEYDSSRWPGAFRETFLMDPSFSERRKHRPRNVRVGGKKPPTRQRGSDSALEDDPDDDDDVDSDASGNDSSDLEL